MEAGRLAAARAIEATKEDRRLRRITEPPEARLLLRVVCAAFDRRLPAAV